MRASIEDLPGVVERVGGSGQVLFDGGIRRGSDVVMAAALGAQFSFVGRATLYGVGAGGLEGVLRAIEILRSRVAYTMEMIGCKTVYDIGPGMWRQQHEARHRTADMAVRPAGPACDILPARRERRVPFSRIAQLASVGTLIACLALNDYEKAVKTIQRTFQRALDEEV